MDERKLRIGVAVVVVAAAIVAFVLVLLFGEKRTPFQATTTIYLKFDQAPGAAAGTPVRKNGVLVGRVEHVELMDEGGVLITATLNDRYKDKIHRNEAVVIRSGSLIGDAVLEFVPNRNSTDTSLIENSEFISNTAVANDPIQVLVNLEQKVSGVIDRMANAAEAIEVAGSRMGSLAENLNTVVANNGDQFQRIVQKTEIAMTHFHSAMSSIDELVGDPEFKQELKRALRTLPSLFDDAKLTLTDARKTLNAFQQMSSHADANLQNLEKFTKPLAERGDALVNRIETSVGMISELLDQLVKFSSALNSGEGSLGPLLHDRELYDRLKRTATNVEDATRQLKPILSDVRVFTDKIATDPRQLGIKGALDRRPNNTGTKNLTIADE